MVFTDRDILRAPWQFQSASTLPALTGFDWAPLSKASRSPWRRCSWPISQNSDLMFTSSQVLLTTCVGSKEELEMLVTAASQFYAKYYQHSGSATPAKVSDIVNMRRVVIMITFYSLQWPWWVTIGDDATTVFLVHHFCYFRESKILTVLLLFRLPPGAETHYKHSFISWGLRNIKIWRWWRLWSSIWSRLCHHYQMKIVMINVIKYVAVLMLNHL